MNKYQRFLAANPTHRPYHCTALDMLVVLGRPPGDIGLAIRASARDVSSWILGCAPVPEDMRKELVHLALAHAPQLGFELEEANFSKCLHDRRLWAKVQRQIERAKLAKPLLDRLLEEELQRAQGHAAAGED